MRNNNLCIIGESLLVSYYYPMELVETKKIQGVTETAWNCTLKRSRQQVNDLSTYKANSGPSREQGIPIHYCSYGEIRGMEYAHQDIRIIIKQNYFSSFSPVFVSTKKKWWHCFRLLALTCEDLFPIILATKSFSFSLLFGIWLLTTQSFPPPGAFSLFKNPLDQVSPVPRTLSP